MSDEDPLEQCEGFDWDGNIDKNWKTHGTAGAGKVKPGIYAIFLADKKELRYCREWKLRGAQLAGSC